MNHLSTHVSTRRLSVGVNNVPGAVQLLAKDVIAYTSGHCVATCCIDASVRSRISEPMAAVRNITAMAASNNRRWLAVAEFMTGGAPPQITVLDTHKGMERHLSLQAPGVFKYACVKFSEDDKAIIATGGDDEQNDSMFHVWDWQTSPAAPACSGETRGEVSGLLRQGGEISLLLPYWQRIHVTIPECDAVRLSMFSEQPQ